LNNSNANSKHMPIKLCAEKRLVGFQKFIAAFYVVKDEL
jgi:hypothetical protein